MKDTRFSGRQITTMVIAVCAAAVLMPVGVAASTGSLVTIADPSHSSYRAHVSSAGNLAVTLRDPATGSPAKVDSGSLRVDGTVHTVAGGGTQAVRGTVKVGNLPATQKVSGTVTAEPGGVSTPYVSSSCDYSGNVQFTTGTQQLTAQTISIELYTASGTSDAEADLSYESGGQTGFLHVPLAFTYVDTNGYDHWAATLPVTLEIDPKTDVFITPNLYGGSLEADCLTVSGYLG